MSTPMTPREAAIEAARIVRDAEQSAAVEASRAAYKAYRQADQECDRVIATTRAAYQQTLADIDREFPPGAALDSTTTKETL